MKSAVTEVSETIVQASEIAFAYSNSQSKFSVGINSVTSDSYVLDASVTDVKLG